jgi:uncharacterized protein involved in exopolysaccharide biosynthesis
MQEDQTKDIQDFIVAIRKRKIAVISILSTILIITVLVAYLLPATYKSGSTILIERQEIPQEMVQTTVTSYASETIQVIQARVMTRTNLMRIIDKFELYEDERKVETSEEIIQRMREDVSLDVISADVVDPRTGRPSLATIAFSLSFVGESPEKVQRVANELTTLYLDENLTSRSQKAAETSEFFTEELDRLSEQTDELENKIALFKEEHSDALPELQQLNMNVLQRKEAELLALDSRMLVLDEKSFYLKGQLDLIEPGNPDIPGSVERLKTLLSAYASVRSRYSDEHPDVVRLKNEIDSLEKETGRANSADAIAEQLKLLNAELAQIKDKYTEEHPDIVVLKEKISALNSRLSDLKNRPEEEYYEEKPDNPLYISLESQLATVESELGAIKLQREKTLDSIDELEKSLYKSPQVEREYLVLKRDYANTVNRYQQTKAKQMQADIAKQLESESKGERFTLIEPATYPEIPISPNRPLIAFIGFILAVACSIGFAVLADIISGTVRGVKGVQGLVGALPLSVIPYEANLQERVNTVRIKKRVIVLFVVIVLFALVFIHLVITPLDVVWFKLLRKIDVLTA